MDVFPVNRETAVRPQCHHSQWLLSGVALLLAGCVGVASSLRSAGHAVVPAREFQSSSGWSPTEEQITACEAALASRLTREKLDLAQYYLRVSGVMRDGTRRIVGFAGKSYAYLQRPPADVVILTPFGGGKDNFRFDYDVECGKLVAFNFNAPL
jgi:hypothetical protein